MERSVSAHDMVNALEANEYPAKLRLLEKILFGLSRTLTYIIPEEAKCSICGERRGQCEHIEGKPYMGQMCEMIVTKFREE